jgi:hypothetical protein
MELAKVRRATASGSMLILGFVCVLALSCPLRAQETQGKTTTVNRPGDAPYTPTKLEWAALEMQANFASTWTTENPVAIAYMAADDGTTIRCLLQYTSNVSAQLVKTSREAAQLVFDRYAARRGWAWLRLRFEEQILPSPH